MDVLFASRFFISKNPIFSFLKSFFSHCSGFAIKYICICNPPMISWQELSKELLPDLLNSQMLFEGNLDIVSERSGTVVPLKIL